MAEERRLPVALIGGTVAGLFLLAGILYLGRPGMQSLAPPVPDRLPPPGAIEKEYIANVQFSQLGMSRAANFLGQEVTYLDGVVTNAGSRRVRAIEIVLDFRDLMGQTVMRETIRPLGRRAPPLAPGSSREFRLAFEHVPVMWNQAVPDIEVTGLLLE
jgi:hypothetical protein